MTVTLKKTLIVILSCGLSLALSMPSFASSDIKQQRHSNLKEMKFTRESGAGPKLSYFSQSITDLSSNKDKDCDTIFKEINALLPLRSKFYFSIASLYCLQPANEQGHHIAKLLKLDHLIESTGSEISSTELYLFLSKYKNYTFYDQKQVYYPINHMEKTRNMKARHSFEKLYDLVSDEFSVPVKNLEDFINEGKTFVSDLNFKDKEVYTKQMKGLFGEYASKAWIELFNNPEADVFSYYLSQTRIIVDTDNNQGGQDYISQYMLSEDNFIDTRWDEFIESPSTSPLPKVTNYVVEKICLKVDTQKTDDAHYKNMATPVNDNQLDFEVNHDKVSCFDFDTSYYMQHYLKTQGNSIWYGTTCRYLPYKRHEGKTLYYIGEHGQYKCPVK